MASDSGSGKLGDYRYNLVPANKRVTIRLADSDPYQEEIASLVDEETLLTFIAARTIEEERTDAPMPVRFFTGRRMSGIVGYVPRGLEPAVIEALTRIEDRSNNRIPASIVKKGGQLRVVLLMGDTR
ncbi:MAG: hypothetical protein QOH69_1008 [Actinomycetota bacterium]|nr:hypothetical protein [Actinomycetota bacterium]MDQ1552369.1 hypothetical protein [Actinomycetota bacterium]